MKCHLYPGYIHEIDIKNNVQNPWKSSEIYMHPYVSCIILFFCKIQIMYSFKTFILVNATPPSKLSATNQYLDRRRTKNILHWSKKRAYVLHTLFDSPNNLPNLVAAPITSDIKNIDKLSLFKYPKNHFNKIPK